MGESQHGDMQRDCRRQSGRRDAIHPLRLPILAGAIVIALAGAIWLWANYSATVFFETVRVGFVACFG